MSAAPYATGLQGVLARPKGPPRHPKMSTSPRQRQANLACPSTASQFGSNFAEASLCVEKILQHFSKMFKKSLITLSRISSSNCHSNCHFEQQSKKCFSHS